jgi:hypothetical protein
MPHPGLIWRHVIINTRGSWLHGDRRGFRSRSHVIHSSGDYRHPPPPEEHAGLLDYQQARVAPALRIPRAVRGRVGKALLARCRLEGWRVLAVGVSDAHAHLLMELPLDRLQARCAVGRCKGAASFAVREVLPGGVWGQRGDLEPIRHRRHQLNTYRYIVYKQGPKAWTWSFTDGEREPTRE